jgi:Zn-dependent protease with chaperone function
MTINSLKTVNKHLIAALVLWAVAVAPFAPLAAAQTEIKAPKNKYKIQDDIKLGRDAANEVEKQMPILNDAAATRYVAQVGERLVAAIPPEFQHPEFKYTFKIVNARDINAFALPGGPMYVNRGMIESAKNEGEMAGVMAHEISHVALRHGTAQATKASNPLNQILGIGAILGGAVLAGQTGAELGQAAFGAYFLRFSRDAETQADTLGAQIMARAGYDPNDLANMFKTIEAQGGGSGGPDWLSDHPNPSNRYKNIENEAKILRVSGDPIKNSPAFEQTKRKLQSMPRARSMAEIEKEGKVYNNNNGGGSTTTSPAINGVYKDKVAAPSSKYKTYKNSNFITMSVPNNWTEMSDPSDGSIYFSPEGAYGKDGITRGTLLGMFSPKNRTLASAHEEYVSSILSGNTYLQKQGSSYSSTTGGRSGMATKLMGTSPVTGKSEVVMVYSVMLSNGSLLYLAGVSPETELTSYNRAFNFMRSSMQINDK